MSVIIPCRNEVDSIGALLDDIAAQAPTGLTVVIADGMSDDGTLDLLQDRQRAARDPFVLKIVSNADRTIPHALNRAVEATDESLIIRLDAHGRIGAGFFTTMAAQLGEYRNRLVGPRVRMIPSAPGFWAAAIAFVLNSSLGNGGTPSRGSVPAPKLVAHTVMSCWHRQVWVDNGGFDESLLSNEDFAFDWTAKKRGCEVLSLPEPEYQLQARPTLGALARQRWRYGWWKSVVLRRHPSSLHVRQFIPVLALILAGPLLVFTPLLLAGCVGLWLLLVWLIILPTCRREGLSIIAMLFAAPLIVAIIQFVWALGVVLGFLFHFPGPPRPGARFQIDVNKP